MKKTNYHSHSTFCDGKAGLREMVQSAVEHRFDIFGFSGHSMYPFACDWHIAPREHAAYAQETRELAKEFQGKIELYTGFEADYIQGVCCPRFDRYKEFKPDFLVGSVHYVPGKGGFFEADGPFDETRENIRRYFGGDVKLAVQTYFALEREMLREGDFTFMGHCDLIRKQNAVSPLFSEEDSWYKNEIKATAQAIASSGVCVEINTGGMARGYMDSPYPSLYFLELLREKNVPVTINSDTHSPDTVDYAFDQAAEHAKKAGYTELMYYTAGQLKSQKID